MSQYFTTHNDRIECTLCPHYCKIAAGRTGLCGVRKNNGYSIELSTYGIISGISTDPVEKKPLYHFYPGYNILSAGSFGCNMKCDFCQNYNISQIVPQHSGRKIMPEELLRMIAGTERNIGIAFTYNEPTISFEYVRDVAIKVKETGYMTVLVSNGYVNKQPLQEIISFIDAFNIDLKSFNKGVHKRLTGAKLDPVLDSLKLIAASGKHLEITSLIIPGYNDTEEEMSDQAEWIASELGKNVPLHLSKYYPMYKRDDPATSVQTLEKLHNAASSSLNYVYIGNVSSDAGQETKCPSCGTVVTERMGFSTRNINSKPDGSCSVCGYKIYKDFIFSSPTDC